MAINIREIDLAEAKGRVVKQDGRAVVDNPFVDVLKKLTPERGLEIVLDEGDTPKAIKTQITRASKEIGIRVTYGETEDGTLVVTLAGDDERAAGERGRKRGANVVDLPAAK